MSQPPAGLGSTRGQETRSESHQPAGPGPKILPGPAGSTLALNVSFALALIPNEPKVSPKLEAMSWRLLRVAKEFLSIGGS